MSAITVENDLVHYEVLGRGRPVIFVHGWLGSWRYWVPTMQQLSVKYRTYALDLWGFGDSGKESARYTFKDQVQLLNDFMEKLGIAKAALVGHSLGAAVCLRFAALHPDRAPRVALINMPLYDLGGFDDSAISGPAPKPISVTTAPASGGPASTPTTSTPAAPVTTTPPPPTTPATPAAGPSTSATPATPTSPTPTPAPTTTAVAPATTPPATTTPTPAPSVPGAPAEGGASTTDTIPRNPFRNLGDSPEEILARLQAKNMLSSAGLGAPGTSSAMRAPKPETPTLPTSIATPILPKQPQSPARTDAPNPLIRILNAKPAELLTRYVDPHAPDFDKLRAEVEKTDERAIIQSVQSFNGVNLAVELQRMPAPTLLLHGKDDPVFAAPSDELLTRIYRGKQPGYLLSMVEPGLRHFPMLEITAKFNRLLLDFLEAQDLTNVQFKDQWVRTMR